MSNISSTTSFFSNYESLVQKRITNAASSGQISQADGTAIGSALGDIATQLQSSTTQGTQGSGPGQLRNKLDTLINGEVSSGKLTDAQATELKNFLQPNKNGPGGAGGAHGAGHSHHAKGASDGKDKENDGDGDDQAGVSNTLSTALQNADPSQSTSTSSNDPLASFLKILQDAQTSLAGATYSNSAVSKPNATSSLGLVNQFA